MHAFKLFSTSQSAVLTQSIAEILHVPIGKMQTTHFSDGEVNVTFQESIRGVSIVLIAQINLPYANIFELFIAIDAARRASAKEIICVIPYLPHSRQERKDDQRAAITARLLADFLELSGATRIITIDMHATSIEGFYKIPIDHLGMAPVFAKDIRQKFTNKNLCFCSPDFGGTKRIKEYKKALGGQVAIIHKERDRPNKVATMEIIGNVKGQTVIIIDDLIDTGGTIIKAAECLKENGANTVVAYCTHGVFSKNAKENIANSAIDSLVLTDTIPQNTTVSNKFVTISVADTIAKAIERLMQQGSIKQLKQI